MRMLIASPHLVPTPCQVTETQQRIQCPQGVTVQLGKWREQAESIRGGRGTVPGNTRLGLQGSLAATFSPLTPAPDTQEVARLRRDGTRCQEEGQETVSQRRVSERGES